MNEKQLEKLEEEANLLAEEVRILITNHTYCVVLAKAIHEHFASNEALPRERYLGLAAAANGLLKKSGVSTEPGTGSAA